MADTRLRYIGPIDGVELSVAGVRVPVVAGGEVELADHLPAKDAGRVAKQLVETGDWTTVQRETTKDAGASGGEK